MSPYEDYGRRPFAAAITGPVTSRDGAKLLMITFRRLDSLRLECPQLNYYLRKMRMKDSNQLVDWRLGKVDILNPS